MKTTASKIQSNAAKLILISLLALFIINKVNAQGSWTQKSSLSPTCYTQSNADLVIGDKAYIGLGTDFCHDWYEYDPATDTWTQKASLSDTAASDPATFSIGNYGYVLCDNNHLWQYDPSSDTWTNKTDFPGPIRFLPSFFTIGNKGYVGGGLDNFNNSLTDYWSYNAISDTWAQIASCPLGNALGEGFSVNGKGYITFPAGASYSSYVYEYDPAADTWTQKSNAPDSRIAPSSFVLGNKAYIGMGIVKVNGVDSLSNIFYEYDPQNDTWTRMTYIPDNGIYDEGVGFAINNKGYMGLGDCNPAGNSSCVPGFYQKLYEYSPAIGTGIGNLETEYLLTVFPNPGNGLFAIQTASEKENFIVSNLEGRIVYKSVNKAAMEYIDLSFLENGIYLYSCIINDRTMEGKIIILH